MPKTKLSLRYFAPIFCIGGFFVLFFIFALPGNAWAATNIYYSIGQNTGDHKTDNPTITISGGVATFSVAQTATNMGVGDKISYGNAAATTTAYISAKQSNTVWNVVTALGAQPAATTTATVLKISHAFDSLAAALPSGAGGAKGSSYLNTTDLVAGNYILNIPCYHDSGPDEAEVTVSGWTTGANNYIKIYTPYSTSTEANASQRHSGVWDSTKYNRVIPASETGNNNILVVNGYVRIEGLQLATPIYQATYNRAIYVYDAAKSVPDVRISDNIIVGSAENNFGGRGILLSATGVKHNEIYNNVIYGFNGDTAIGIYAASEDSDISYIYSNTIVNSYYCIHQESTANLLKDNLCFNNTGDYTGPINSYSNHNAYSGAYLPGGNDNLDLTGRAATDIFINPAGNDFHLKSGSPAINVGANLSADSYLAFNDDVKQQIRPAVWDIGADEFFSSSSDVTAPVITLTGTSTTVTTATISWTTDEAATSSVYYGTSTGYGLAYSSDSFSFSHSVFLENLKPDTIYHFQVASADASGNRAVSADHIFTTASGTISLLAHTGITFAGEDNGLTTDPIDTTGASLIVVGVHVWTATSSVAVTDNMDNSWHYLKAYGSSKGSGFAQLWYSYSPTTSPSHTFSINGASANYSSLTVSAWSGTDDTAAVFDKETGNSESGNPTIQTGAVTPAQNGELLISLLSNSTDATVNVSVNGGFSLTDVVNNGYSMVGGMAYRISPNTGVNNPSWTIVGANNQLAAGIVAFRPTNTNRGQSLGLHAKSVEWLDATHIRATYDWTDADQLLDWTPSSGTTLSRGTSTVGIFGGNGSVYNMTWKQPIAVSDIKARENPLTSGYINVYTNLSSSWYGNWDPNPTLGNIWYSGGGVWVFDGNSDYYTGPKPVANTWNNYEIQISPTLLRSWSDIDDTWHERAGTYSPSKDGIVGLGAYQGNTNWGQVVIEGEINVAEVASSTTTISSIASSTIASAALIAWDTNNNASSTVRYGLSSDYGLSSSVAGLVSSHSVILRGLTANTTYHFRVESTDANGNLATSSDLTFRTSASNKVITAIAGQKTGGQAIFKTSSTSVDVAFPKSVTASDTILILLTTYDSGETPSYSVVKTAGTATISSFTIDKESIFYSNHMKIVVARALVTGSGSLTVKVSAIGTGYIGAAVGANEYLGMAASPVDGAPDERTGSSTTEATNAITTSGPGMIAMISAEVSTENFVYTQSDTNIAKFSNGSDNLTMQSQYKITTSTGPYILSASTGNSWDWISIAVAYKAAVESSDTEDPTTPTNVAAAAISSSRINITWNVSTDNVGVAGYTIYRGGTKIGTTSATFYSDNNLASSTAYSYTVDAFDAAGNRSAQSTAAVATTSATRIYKTNFSTAENPISESGNWINGGTTGLDWANVRSTGGLAVGNDQLVSYNDPTAILSGSWGSNQIAQATVHSVNQNPGIYEELELRLRTSISAHSITGYEVLFSARPSTDSGRYIQIVRWNGPLGDFTYVASTPGPGLNDGDIVKATIVGNVITAYINNVQILQGTDSTYATGSPGIGFYGEDGTNNNDYGFTKFIATDGSLSGTKAISSFSFNGLTPAVDGTINQANHTIALTVPYGTDVTALVPTITENGAWIAPVSNTAQNFTNPVHYTVTAEDFSTQDYIVTVTVAAEIVPPSYTIGGTISGLSGTVVLQNNGGDNLAISANGTFAFSAAKANGTNYAVSVLTKPAGQTCSVSSGTGSINGANITNVAITCVNNPTNTTSSGGGGGAVMTDKIPPAAPAGFSASSSKSSVIIVWTNPPDSDFAGVKLFRKMGSAPTGLSDPRAELIYQGKNQIYTDMALSPTSSIRYYSISAFDSHLNYSALKNIFISPGYPSPVAQPAPVSSSSAPVATSSAQAAANPASGPASTETIINEVAILISQSVTIDLSPVEKGIYAKTAIVSGNETITQQNKDIIANFIHYGTPSTRILGAGERGATINSYAAAFGHLPATEADWQDVVRIANGRWPRQVNAQAEARAKINFNIVYRRNPDMANPRDNAAVTVMAYGLRPANRNLNSEIAAIKSFKSIYRRNPSAAREWNVVRAIAYSGAKR